MGPGPWPLYQIRNPIHSRLYSLDEDQLVAGPLLTHRTAETQNERTDMQASSGILTRDPIVRASEDSSWLRPRGHRDR
jgi:hypothetical protein